MTAESLRAKCTRRAWLPFVMTLGLSACATSPAPLHADLAITNIHVVDTRTGQVLRDRTILVRGTRIAAVGDTRQPSSVARKIDGQGAHVIPGLWDAHLHLLQDDAAGALRAAHVLLSYGVTHARDMGSSAAALAALRSRANAAEAPVIVASGPAFWAFELPYGDKAQQRIVSDAPSISSAVRETADAGADFIKVYAGFPPDKLTVLADAAARRGLRIAGHAQSGAPLDEQARIGLLTVEHLDTATFEGCGVDPDTYFERIIAARFRDSGEALPTIFDAFVQDVDRAACVAMLRRATDAGLAMTPTLMASFLPPSIARRLATDLPPERRQDCERYLAAFKEDDLQAEATYADARNALIAMVRDSGMPILAGTDSPAFCGTAGPSLAMELALLHQSGLSPLEVLQSATLLPARVFGFGDRLGAIAPGMEADFVLLRGNPMLDVSAYAQPVGLFTGGRWRDNAELIQRRRMSTSSAD